MKRLMFVLLFVNCFNPTEPAVSKHDPTYADTLAQIDTAYVDPVSGHIKPPCSMSPDYCSCMKHRGARIDCE